MTLPAQDPWTVTYPTAAWTWYDGKGGTLSTEIDSSGHVRQQRQHDQADEITPQNLGTLPPDRAAALLAHCRQALSAGPAEAGAPLPMTRGSETYQIILAEGERIQTSRQVSRTALKTDPALSAFRREILSARQQAYRRWNIWTSAGARWFFLTLAVTLALALYMITDMTHDAKLQARAQRTVGTVIDKGGVPYKSEYLDVRLDAIDGAPTVNIFKYLSHPHWDAATPGAKEDVLYDAGSKEAWLAADLLRWQSDKKTIWVLPGFLLFAAFVGLAWLRRYQIGVYGDGEEFMIHEDRVAGDDKDALIKRSTVLWFKMFV